MSRTRTESDSFGPIEVPADALWGAQTARSLRFFAIGEQRMPIGLIHALAWLKWAAACVNRELQLLDAGKAQAIAAAAERVAAGEFDAEFPLSVWPAKASVGPGFVPRRMAHRLVTRKSAGPQTCVSHAKPSGASRAFSISWQPASSGVNDGRAISASASCKARSISVAPPRYARPATHETRVLRV